MQLKKILCLVLVCLVLCGCGTPKSDGNMENALSALLWEDYDTAFREADAFLERMPESRDAKLIRESAAWGKFNRQTLAMKLSKGTFTQLEYGFRVDDLPQQKRSDIQITGYWVGMDYDRETISGREVSYLYLRSMTIYWTDAAGAEHAYEIYDPDQISRKDLSGAVLELPGDTSQIDQASHEQLSQLAEKVIAPSLKEVFKELEKQTGLKPEYLGFTAWNS